MTTVSPEAANWTWSPEILTFASEAGVAEYLDPMMESARRLFPAARAIRVRLEADPEIPNDRHLTFEVETAIETRAQYRALSRSWGEEVFRLCPAPLVCVFREILIPVA